MLVRHLVLAGCSALALACSSTTGGQDGTRSDDVTNVAAWLRRGELPGATRACLITLQID